MNQNDELDFLRAKVQELEKEKRALQEELVRLRPDPVVTTVEAVGEVSSV